MSKHTPGPWAVYSRLGVIQIDIGEDRGARPCIVDWPGFESTNLPDAENLANARLIAAAPDLLESLKRFHSAAKSWHDFHHGTDIACDLLCECIAPAAAAIEKATASREGSAL